METFTLNVLCKITNLRLKITPVERFNVIVMVMVMKSNMAEVEQSFQVICKLIDFEEDHLSRVNL